MDQEPAMSDARETANLPSDDEIVVAVCSDDNYVMPLSVTVCSLAFNLGPGERAVIYVIDGGITLAHQRKLVNRVSRTCNRVRLIFVPADLRTLGELREVGHLGSGTYLRLLIPALLPAELEKVVCLDSDLIVRASVAGLWSAELGDAPLMAVQDSKVKTFGQDDGPITWYDLIGIDGEVFYFNAGVTVMNLNRWRSERFALRIAEFLKENASRLRWADQDGINVILAGRIRPLDPSWNVQYAAIHSDPSVVRNADWRPRATQLKKCRILHYTGAEKPWSPNVFDPERLEFLKYLSRSRWIGSFSFLSMMARYGFTHVRVLYLRPLKASIRCLLHGVKKPG